MVDCAEMEVFKEWIWCSVLEYQ